MIEGKDNDRKGKSAQHRRMEIIETVLRTEGKVRTADLADRFGIGQNLLANDLKRLEELGLVVRGHGWVMRRATEIDDFFSDSDYEVRKRQSIKEKEALAEYVVDHLIEDGALIYMEAGTTAFQIGEKLIEREKNVEIVTNNLPLVLHLARHSSIPCNLVAGEYSRKHAAIVGDKAAQAIEGEEADISILTPRAISFPPYHTLPDYAKIRVEEQAKKRGESIDMVKLQNIYINVYSEDPDQFSYKGNLIKNCHRLIIALDHTKFAISGRHFFSLIVGEEVEPSRGRGIRLHTRAAIRTRGPVSYQEAIAAAPKEGQKDVDVRDPVDLKPPLAVNIVTTAEEGDLPSQMVQFLLFLIQYYKEHEPSSMTSVKKTLDMLVQDELVEETERLLEIVGPNGKPLPGWRERLADFLAEIQ